MAVSRVTTWTTNQVLTSSALNGEFNNILNNGLSVVSPWTGNMDAGGFRLITLSAGSVSNPTVQPTGDTNTGIYFSAADTVDIATGGVNALSIGASFVLRAAPEDTRTTTVDVAGIIESTTSGVPAAGIGVGLQFNAESADENPSVFGRIDFAASDVTAASEDTYMDILLRVAGVAAETKWRFASTAGTGFRMDLTHAATANRVVTIQDSAAQTLVARDTTDTLTNKTLTSPTMAGTTIRVLDRVTADIVVANTVTETTIYTVSLPGALLSTNNQVRLTLAGKISAGASEGDADIRLKYGATTVATVVDAAVTATTDQGFVIECWLCGDAATNAQVGNIQAVAANSQADTANGTAAEDSTGALTLAVTLQWGVASASRSYTRQYGILQLIAAP